MANCLCSVTRSWNRVLDFYWTIIFIVMRIRGGVAGMHSSGRGLAGLHITSSALFGCGWLVKWCVVSLFPLWFCPGDLLAWLQVGTWFWHDVMWRGSWQSCFCWVPLGWYDVGTSLQITPLLSGPEVSACLCLWCGEADHHRVCSCDAVVLWCCGVETARPPQLFVPRQGFLCACWLTWCGEGPDHHKSLAVPSWGRVLTSYSCVPCNNRLHFSFKRKCPDVEFDI